METKNIILKLRTERGMSQDELADKIMVTRQAVSRWEHGDTIGSLNERRFRYLITRHFVRLSLMPSCIINGWKEMKL